MYMQHIYMKEKTLALGKSLNIQKVNLVSCVTPVVLGTAAQKGCLHCCETVTESIYLKEETYFLQRGL